MNGEESTRVKRKWSLLRRAAFVRLVKCMQDGQYESQWCCVSAALYSQHAVLWHWMLPVVLSLYVICYRTSGFFGTNPLSQSSPGFGSFGEWADYGKGSTFPLRSHYSLLEWRTITDASAFSSWICCWEHKLCKSETPSHLSFLAGGAVMLLH